MSKDRKTYRLSDEDLEYINSISEQYNIDNTKALEKIIGEHRQQRDTKQLSKEIAAEVISAFEEKYKNTFTRIRLAATGADQNSLILLEMLNSVLVATKLNEHAYTSRIAKSKVWIECEKEVKRRIAHFKQKKDNKNQGDIL